MSRIMRVDHGCVKCDSCRWECRFQAISFDREGARIDPRRCTGCGRCIAVCPAEAISSVEIKP